MRRLNVFCRLLLLLLAVALPSVAERVSTIPAPTGYIDDYAGVFSSSATSSMESECRELHDKTKAQVFVVTVNTTEGEPVETFANELFAKWKIGEKKTDRGILMLFAIKDRKRWIEVGYGFEGILNDAKVGDIGRSMVPALREANYDEAASTGLGQITKIIADDAGVTLGTEPAAEEQGTAPAPVTSPPQPSSALQSPASKIFLAIFFFVFPPVFIICIFIWGITNALRKGRLARGGSSYGSGSSFDSGSSDSFGSSSDSGGDSFGGGDGGSSGGGGAGGDW